MDRINILSIGNSFSQDAHYYLHDLAKREGVCIETVNLMIGGCSLEVHYRNMKGDKKEYCLEINGHSNTGFKVSIKEALLARSWDYVTIQQASRLSYMEDSFVPYAEELVKYIRELCPKAKVLLHQTWAYENASSRLEECGFRDHNEMFQRIEGCYEQCYLQCHADGIIPSGLVLKNALSCGISSVHRDTVHASLGVGRFLLALTWYKYLTKRSIDSVSCNWLDGELEESVYNLALQSINCII